MEHVKIFAGALLGGILMFILQVYIIFGPDWIKWFLS